MYIEGTITTTVDGRTALIPFCIDTHTGLWRHGGQQTHATTQLLTALRDAACDRS